MTTGVVKWFNAKKGYGFIQPEDGGKDVFIHASALEAAGISKLDEGDRISYELASNNGKTCASNVQIIK